MGVGGGRGRGSPAEWEAQTPAGKRCEALQSIVMSQPVAIKEAH